MLEKSRRPFRTGPSTGMGTEDADARPADGLMLRTSVHAMPHTRAWVDGGSMGRTIATRRGAAATTVGLPVLPTVVSTRGSGGIGRRSGIAQATREHGQTAPLRVTDNARHATPCSALRRSA